MPSRVADLEQRFDRHLAGLGLPAGRALVAVSGGPDSVALLDLLAHSSSASALELIVLHVDHGINPDSGSVAARVCGLAERLRLPFSVERLALGPGTSETRARQARHAAFRRAARSERANMVMTAHHADDQVETLLMRFLRGSGPAGLAGIAARRGLLVRPLLPFSRAELRAHVETRQLDAWDDPANRDPRHDRSWIRQRLLPELEQRWPNLRIDLARAAELFREDRRGWDALLNELDDLDLRREHEAVSVAVPPLLRYSSELIRMVLRALARRLETGVSGQHLDEIEALVAHGHTGSGVDLPAGARAELTFGRLRLFRAVEHPIEGETRLEESHGEVRVGGWVLKWQPENAPSVIERTSATTWLATLEAVVARAWTPGDRIRPIAGRGSRLVVRCMQDERIPRGERPNWLVLDCRGEVVWVPSVCRSGALVPVPGAQAVRIDARRE